VVDFIDLAAIALLLSGCFSKLALGAWSFSQHICEGEGEEAAMIATITTITRVIIVVWLQQQQC